MNKDQEQVWREEWVAWLITTGNFTKEKNKEYLFSIIDQGLSGWKDSLDSYLAGRKAGQREVDLLIYQKEEIRLSRVRYKNLAFERLQEIESLKKENDALSARINSQLTGLVDMAEFAEELKQLVVDYGRLLDRASSIINRDNQHDPVRMSYIKQWLKDYNQQLESAKKRSEL